MEWREIISWVISVILFVTTIITFIKTGRKERKAEYIEEDAKIDSIKESLIKVNIKLDSLCATTNETRSDIKAMDEHMRTVEQRVLTLENNLKTVWIRIDELKEQVKNHD